jgi:hypothetical protein
MPIVQLQTCTIEGDLAQAVNDMQQQVGEVTQAMLAQIAAIDTNTAGIQGINAFLDDMVQSSPPGNTGLPPEIPTALDNEMRLQAVGLILIDGILYEADDSGNIEVLRQLFFAVGSNVTTFLNLLNSTEPMIVTQTYLNIEKLPPGTTTLAAAQTLFNNPAIENVYVAGDGNYYCVVPQFLGVNISAQQASTQFSIPINQISTLVFWLKSVQATSNEITRMDQLGITGPFKVAAISGTSLTSASPSTVSTTQAQASVDTGTALSQCQLLNSRYALISQDSIANFQNEILMSSKTAQQDWLALEQQVRFQAFIIIDPTIMITFLTRNSQADITYLMNQRRTVSGINFNATQDDIANLVQQADNIPAGSTTISAVLINTPSVQVPTPIDNANNSLITNYCALNQLSGTSLSYIQLQIAYGCLSQSIATPAPTPVAPVVPIMGYQSYDSPASIMFSQVNFAATFNTTAATNALSALGTALGQPLLAIVEAIIALITSMRAALDQVLGNFAKQVASFVAQIQSMTSKFTSFFGTASLDSSILKCSVGFNIAATIPALNELAGLIDLLRRQLKNILAQIAKLIENFIETLICLPLNLINGFITGATTALPSFCQVNRVVLPQQLQNALLQLKQGFQIENTNVTAFARDAIKLSATVQALPAKLSQFQSSLLCQSQPNAKFFSATQFTLNQGFFANPTTAAANLLKPIGG